MQSVSSITEKSEARPSSKIAIEGSAALSFVHWACKTDWDDW